MSWQDAYEGLALGFCFYVFVRVVQDKMFENSLLLLGIALIFAILSLRRK